jgi:hypothetical protein
VRLLAFTLIATAIAAALVVASLIAGRARRIARLTQRLELDPLEPRSTYPTIVVAPGRHLRTVHLLTGAHLDWIGARPGAAGELGVTDRELLLTGDRELIRIPLSRAIDAAFIREFEGAQAGPQLAFLRLVWKRGGEQLATTFAIDTSWTQAEKLRREIHLRLGARAS